MYRNKIFSLILTALFLTIGWLVIYLTYQSKWFPTAADYGGQIPPGQETRVALDPILSPIVFFVGAIIIIGAVILVFRRLNRGK